MQRLILFILLSCLVNLSGALFLYAEDVTPRRDLVEFQGSRDFVATWRTELTDGSPTATISTTANEVAFVNDVIVDIITDKGGSLTITPLPDSDDLNIEGEVSSALTIAPGGETRRIIYTKISAPNVKVVFTKTESGTTSGFLMFVKGTGR